MALIEQRILNQVTTLPNQSAIQVQWVNQILRDEEVISQTYERKAYMQEQKNEFLAEVEGAEGYFAIMGW